MAGFPRKYFARESETLSNAQTLITNLDINSPITAVDLHFEATNGATSGRNNYIHDKVSRVEVVDGSDVLYSANMKDAQAVNWYMNKKFPYMLIDEGADAVQREVMRINFGRYLGDTDYYLNPADFTNLQLKETHSLNIAADSGFATGSGLLSVIVHLMDGDIPSPRGFLMTKEVYSYTSAASGVETIELPDDYPIRAMFVHSYEAAIALETDLTNVKLSLGMDRFIPFDMPIDLLLAEIIDNFGKCEYDAKMLMLNDDTQDLFVALPMAFSATSILASASLLEVSATIVSAVGSRVTVQVTDHNTTSGISHTDYTTDVPFRVNVSGYLPHNVLGWVFAPVGNEDWAYDISTWRKGQLKITDGGAGAANRLVLQQLRSR